MRRARAARQREGEEGGQKSERQRVGQPRPPRPFDAEVVRPSGGHSDQMCAARRRAVREGQGSAQYECSTRRDRHATHLHLARHERLVAPVCRGVPREVDAVIAPADGELSGEHGQGDQTAAEHVAPRCDGQGGDQGGHGQRGGRVGRQEERQGAAAEARATRTRCSLRRCRRRRGRDGRQEERLKSLIHDVRSKHLFRAYGD